MSDRKLGATGLQVPAIGQGTWQLDHAERATAIAGLRRGVELGLRHVDTAEMYGSGAVESLLGEALRGLRDQVFLTSKVLPHNGSYQGTLAACEGSLRRLRTDWLDLYLLHWPGSHPLGETVRAFEALVTAGKIRAWGLSNFDVPELERALGVAGPGRIACNQVLYHLRERAIEHRVLPWCEAHDIAVVGYSPFGSGDFAAVGTAAHQVLLDLGRTHDATARQVALRFLVRRPSLSTIPKAAELDHVADNAAALQLRLDESDLARIDAAFPRGPLPHCLPMI